jgi:hypothetical protein
MGGNATKLSGAVVEVALKHPLPAKDAVYVTAVITVAGTVNVGGARVATPLALVTADPRTTGPTAVLAVKVTVCPGMGALVTAFLSVALIVWMAKVPFVRTRTWAGAAVSVVLVPVTVTTRVPKEPRKQVLPL